MLGELGGEALVDLAGDAQDRPRGFERAQRVQAVLLDAFAQLLDELFARAGKEAQDHERSSLAAPLAKRAQC